MTLREAIVEHAGIDYDADGVHVDAYLQTSNPDVYAAGDCAAIPDGQGGFVNLFTADFMGNAVGPSNSEIEIGDPWKSAGFYGGPGPYRDDTGNPADPPQTVTRQVGVNAPLVTLADQQTLLNAPDVYMEKIAIGPGYPKGVVDLDAPADENIRKLAKAKGVKPDAITAMILDRPRHADLIAEVRKAGAALSLITDGDVAGVIHTADPDKSGIDIFLGIGGAPEGVLAAAALRCIGGQMQGRLIYENAAQAERARGMGVSDPNHKYSAIEMARGDVMFAATGVTSGPMLRGVRRFGGGAVTHSVVMRSKSGTVRYIEAHHNFRTKTWTAS